MEPRASIVVLGAGVIGLQTALYLLEAGFKVTIVARDWPGDQNALCTSVWAGAVHQWRSTSKMNEMRMQDCERRTFSYWQELVKNVPSQETGLEMMPGIYYWEFASPKPVEPAAWIWWTAFIPSYRLLHPADIPASGEHAQGSSYDSFSIYPERYLMYLLSRCKALGATCCTRTVESIAEVFTSPGFESVLGIINCTGIAASELAKDPDVFPTKGNPSSLEERPHAFVLD